MPKTIHELVTEKGNRMALAVKDPDAYEESEINAALAAKAMMEGRLSPSWREYMMQFVDKEPDRGQPFNAKQLARLLATDGTLGDPQMDRRRAYLLGNAVCGGGSTGEGPPPEPDTPLHLNFTVNTIDDGL